MGMPKSDKIFFIRCQVSPGLFSTERQVVVKFPEGREFVAFVDERNVKVSKGMTPEVQKPVDGFVRVFPVNVKKKTALVDLPQGSFTEGPRIEVPTKELVES
jgi:hypothetical protein